MGNYQAWFGEGVMVLLAIGITYSTLFRVKEGDHELKDG